MFSQNRGSAEQLAKVATSTQGKFLRFLLLMTVGLAVVSCVAYAMFGLAFPGGKSGGGDADVQEWFDIPDKSNSDSIAMEVVRMQMKNLAGRGVSVCVQQCMSAAGPPCVEPGRGLETRDADGKPPSGSESDGYPLLWQKVRSKAELGMEDTEQPTNNDGAANRQGTNDAASDRQAADHGASDHQAADHGVSDRQATNHGASHRQATDHGASDRQAADHGASDHQATDHGASDHQAANHGASDRQATDHGASDRQAADHGASDRQATDHGASDRQAANHRASDRQATDHGASDRQARRIAAEAIGHAKTRTESSVNAARRVEKKVGGSNKEPRREERGKNKGPLKGGGSQNKEPRMMNFVEKFKKFVPPNSGKRDHMYYKLAQDDIDLLELATTKANYMPRVALLFLTEGPLGPAPVWENYLRGYEDLYSIYVHQMPRFEFPQNDSKLFARRVIQSENVEWGRMDVVDAQRRLLANAIMNPLNQRFIFLSDSCVPVTDFLFMYHYLIDTCDSFVESAQARGQAQAGEQYDAKGKPIVKREGVQFRSQWFTLTRKHAALIVQDRTYYPAFAWNCVGVAERTDGFCVPGFSRWCRRETRVICDRHEQYIQTVIRNLASHELNQRSVMWASQEGSWDAHAVSWTAEKLRANGSLLESIREQKNCLWNGQEKECFLFAHKFTSDAVPLLLEKGKQLGLWRS
ncbi:hypothetical protein CBR_g1057 [Chara braunii]|uniref:Uncharacterized protein n=1 Tax=Chara braunii TaxID=69332 RepID=A0A388KCZ8_CHABU|nr:hypothetical protein CBR_g1057 [Chara braunii]|eukprot:GBG67938.1 hypothetical protein CBR_g1057 [Chara braunii]